MGKHSQNRLERRRRILESAFELFSSRGVAGVTMAEVAQRAHVSRATTFSYFSSKSALMDAIVGEVLSFYRGMLQRALADERTSTLVLVHALFDQMGRRVDGVRDLSRDVFREIARFRVGPDQGSAAEEMSRAAQQDLAKLLARGQERGEIRGDLETRELALTMDALANATIVDWLFHRSSISLRVRMRGAATFFLRAAATRPSTPAPSELPDLTPDIQVAPQRTGTSERPAKREMR